MPMPAGIVRVYQSDSNGGTQFVGEDRIEHTPKDETLNLKIGNAFDVVAERKQIDFQKIASNVYEMEYADHAAQPQGDADHRRSERADRRHVAHADESSHQWTKTDAWAAQFSVPVAPNGETTLKYRVRVNY